MATRLASARVGAVAIAGVGVSGKDAGKMVDMLPPWARPTPRENSKRTPRKLAAKKNKRQAGASL
jgi:hypothetical protein